MHGELGNPAEKEQCVLTQWTWTG